MSRAPPAKPRARSGDGRLDRVSVATSSCRLDRVASPRHVTGTTTGRATAVSDRSGSLRSLGSASCSHCSAFAAGALKAAEVIEADLCIYGGTAGGVAAAVQAARMGKTAVIAEFGNHLGGLTSGGLGATDIGNKAAIGGIAREFYHRIALHYANSNAWRFEQREEYFATARRALDAQRTEFPGCHHVDLRAARGRRHLLPDGQ